MSAPFLFRDLPAHSAERVVARAAFPLRASAGALAAIALILAGGFGILRLMHPMTFPIRQVEING